MTAPPTPRKPRSNPSAALTCAALLAVFYVVSFLAVLTKCATIDEPLHAMGALIRVYYNDYRLNAEDPPLWNYWVMLPHSRDSLPRVDLSDPMWLNMVETPGFSASF